MHETVHAVTFTLRQPRVGFADRRHFATPAGRVPVRAGLAVPMIVFGQSPLALFDLGAVLGDAREGRPVRAGNPLSDAEIDPQTLGGLLNGGRVRSGGAHHHLHLHPGRGRPAPRRFLFSSCANHSTNSHSGANVTAASANCAVGISTASPRTPRSSSSSSSSCVAPGLSIAPFAMAIRSLARTGVRSGPKISG